MTDTVTGKAKELDTILGNKLIARFSSESNTSYNETGDFITYNGIDAEEEYWQYSNMKYHTSWDWLMPVVEKISKIEFDRDEQELPFGGTEIVIHTHYPRTFGMLNNEGKPMVRFNAMAVHAADTLIEAAWQAVVEFIEWYH